MPPRQRATDPPATLAARLKALRKQAGMSQEQLANRIYVTRQAITKWESGAGKPDITNLTALAAVFAVSIDSLVGLTPARGATADTDEPTRYANDTFYDIDGAKHFDIDCGPVCSCTVCGYAGEQLRVRVAANTIERLSRNVKVNIDDSPKRIDITVRRASTVSETLAKDDLSVYLWIPQQYLTTVECDAKAGQVRVRDLECERLELGLRTNSLRLENVRSHVEVDCNQDMNIQCDTLDGRIDVNQLSATSRITIPHATPVALVTRGLRNRMIVGTGVCQDESASNVIELNGVGSELIVDVR